MLISIKSIVRLCRILLLGQGTYAARGAGAVTTAVASRGARASAIALHDDLLDRCCGKVWIFERLYSRFASVGLFLLFLVADEGNGLRAILGVFILTWAGLLRLDHLPFCPLPLPTN